MWTVVVTNIELWTLNDKYNREKNKSSMYETYNICMCKAIISFDPQMNMVYQIP